MNKLLTSLIFAATATFAMQGFAADAAPTDSAKMTSEAPAKHTVAKKHTTKSTKHKKVHKAADGAADMPAK